jgi:hypothetical protein
MLAERERLPAFEDRDSARRTRSLHSTESVPHTRVVMWAAETNELVALAHGHSRHPSPWDGHIAPAYLPVSRPTT